MVNTFTATLPSVSDATYAGNAQYNLADPYVRALTELLFNQGFSFASQPPPIEALTTQVAPFNPLEQAALDLTSRGIGAYLPYFQRGMEIQEGALPFLGEGASVMRDAYPLFDEAVRGQRDAAMLARSGLAPTERGIYEGMNMLQAGLGSFDEDAAEYYMNPYIEAVMKDQLDDIDEFYDNKILDLEMKAANSGLRGSTRAGLISLDLQQKKAEDRQKLKNQAMASAFGQAQQQFNLEQGALRQAAPTMAGLGQSFGQARSGLAQLLSGLSGNVAGTGSQFANLGTGIAGFAPAMQNISSGFLGAGGALQGLQGADIAALANAGRTARGYEQAVYDTQRQNAFNINQDPYNRTTYLMGLAQGIPSNTMMMGQSQGAVASPMQSTLTGYAPYVNPYNTLQNYLPSWAGGNSSSVYGG